MTAVAGLRSWPVDTRATVLVGTLTPRRMSLAGTSSAIRAR